MAMGGPTELVADGVGGTLCSVQRGVFPVAGTEICVRDNFALFFPRGLPGSLGTQIGHDARRDGHEDQWKCGMLARWCGS